MNFKNFHLMFVVFLCLGLFACGQISDEETRHEQPDISLAEFSDVIKHWRDQHPDEKELLLSENNITGIANNLLLYQRENGGWPTNKNPLLVLSAKQKAEMLAEKSNLDSSLDNRNTYPQIRYLAFAYKHTKNAAYRQAVVNGLKYILNNQYSNGGWAHSPPRTTDYYGHITFADEVMPGVLTLVREVTKQQSPFDFIEQDLVRRSSEAWKKGETLLLNLQVVIDGKKTIWAGQYDKNTLEPLAARSYELAGLQTWESVAVVNYLLAENQPSEKISQAINSAVEWFEENKIRGLKIEKIPTRTIRFDYYTSDYDLIEIEDESAPPIWARFYDLKTQRPFMANRDGTKVYKLKEIKRERRTGYTWYGYWPQQLLSEK